MTLEGKPPLGVAEDKVPSRLMRRAPLEWVDGTLEMFLKKALSEDHQRTEARMSLGIGMAASRSVRKTLWYSRFKRCRDARW